MNELLAQAYGTQGNINTNSGVEKTAEAALLEELEKVAATEGIDLNEFSDDDILEILQEAMGGEGVEKTAAVEGAEDEGQVKLAEADFLGRTMAHAFYDELTSIQQGGTEKTASGRPSDYFLKTAGTEGQEVDPEFAQAFEQASLERAEEILAFLDTGTVKQSSVAIDDEQLDNAVTERAGEMLSEAGYDVDAIAQHLQQ